MGKSPVLRALAGCAGTISLFSTLLETVAILYMVRQLAISPGLLGLIFATGSVGLLAGALLVHRATGRIGLGPVIVGGAMLIALGDLVLPLAGGPGPVLLISLVVGQLLFGVGLTTYRIGQVSLRQAITPDHLQGRMNATMSVVAVGAVPIGALAGGVLGEAIGLRPTLFVAVLGELLAVCWLLFSPVRVLREQPTVGL